MEAFVLTSSQNLNESLQQSKARVLSHVVNRQLARLVVRAQFEVKWKSCLASSVSVVFYQVFDTGHNAFNPEKGPSQRQGDEDSDAVSVIFRCASSKLKYAGAWTTLAKQR